MNRFPRPLIVPLLSLLLFAVMLQPVLPQPAVQPVELIRIYAPSFADGARLAERGIDLLEMRDGDELVALVTAEERAALEADGWQVRSDPESGTMLQAPGLNDFANGYRTVEETEAFLQSMANAYPQLTTLVDFGDSWQKLQPGGSPGYDLWALRITNEARSGPKPIFFLMAAIHARELSTAEIATRFISYLLEGYGKDADVTWLLNEHEIIVAPMINPDGRKIAETGALQRKNLNTSNGFCSIPYQGVDLNRNSSVKWGITGSSDSPCSDLFRGSAAASEPEVQALQQFVSSLFVARPRPIDGTPAPDDTSGVFITLHSYADLVLWPWGFTNTTAPNGAALERLGNTLADFNGYTAQQSVYLYPTSGTTDEWAYGELGLAAFTFEIGPSGGQCSGFMPAYSCLDEGEQGRFWSRNLPALLYAARVARAPYTQPFGAHVENIQIISDTTTLTITADIDGRTTFAGGAELALNNSPALGASTTAFVATDGTFDEIRESVQAVIPKPAAGTLLLIRAQTTGGIWGPISTTWTAPPIVTPRLWIPTIVR